MSAHRLDLIASSGTLDLVCADGGDEFWFETLADGFNVGSPQAVRVMRQSLMRDGSDSYISRYDNRTITFQVAVNGADLLAVQRGETALSLACAGRAQLSWTPPDGIGATTVYEVLNASFEPIADDLAWVRPGKKQQAYALTLECEPFGHAPDPITVTFSPATPTITTLDAGSSTANFSVTDGAPATITTTTWLTEASIKVHQTDVSVTGTTWVTWAGAFTGTTFVAVDLAVDPAATWSPFITFGGNPTLATQTQAGGYTRFFFATPTSPAELRLAAKPSTVAHDFYIGGIYGATSLPSSGVLSSTIEGSVRTNGTIEVSGGALGHTMVYCDPTMLEYGWQPDNSATWANCPEGTYAVYVKHTGALSYSAGTLIDFTVGSQVAYTRTEYASTDDEYFPVGRITLGGRRDGRAGSFTPTMHTAGTGTNRYASFAVRLFRIAPETSLTYVRDVTDTRLVIDLPSLDYPRGGVWGGASGSEVSLLDKTDAWDYPTLTPTRTDFWVRAAGVANPVVTATYYPAAHTFNAYSPS